jgi:nucleoid-associated protein YgaU
MPISRYSRDTIILDGTTVRTATAFRMIRSAVASKSIEVTTITLRGFGRLDELAGRHYGDGRYWWAIAAASGIGWGLQVPPGTAIVIPNIGQVLELIS